MIKINTKAYTSLAVVNKNDGTTTPSPLFLPPRGFPQGLRDERRWVCWSWRRSDGGRWTKPPLRPDGSLASVTEPGHWVDYWTADAAAKVRSFGLGIVVGTEAKTATMRLVCIDLDNCFDLATGQVEDWAWNIIRAANTYTEISPSGMGFKLFGFSSIAPSSALKLKRQTSFNLEGGGDPAIEVLANGRYACVTGHNLPEYETLCDVSGVIASLMTDAEHEKATTKEAPKARAEAFASGREGPRLRDAWGDAEEDVARPADLRRALAGYWNADDYDDWTTAGLALAGHPDGLRLWLEWSATSDKFHEGEARKKWSSFKPTRINPASIFHRVPHDVLSDWAFEQAEPSEDWRDNDRSSASGENDADTRTGGWGPSSEDSGDPGGNKERAENPGAQGTSPWNDADLTYLGTGRRPAPAFPIDLLGPFWGPWAQRQAKGTSAPVDYVALSLLASVGAMLANVRWPQATPTWAEPPVIWAMAVGPPSSSKSPAIDAALKLVREVERDLASGFDETLRQHKEHAAIAKAVRADWDDKVSRAIKNGEPSPPMPSEADEPAEPVCPRIVVGDATTEKLAVLAAGLPRGLLQHRDELAGWLGSFDRYSGGGGGDRAFAIEAYGGRPYTVDRVRHPVPIRIERLSIGVLGGIQPDRLAEILPGADDGLVPRFFIAWPDPKPSFTLARGMADDETSAKAALKRLACIAMDVDNEGKARPRQVPLTPDAQDLLEDFGREMARRGDSASGLFGSVVGKARGHCLRLSCILEFLKWSPLRAIDEPIEISAGSVEQAATLLEDYFLPMAERAYGEAALPQGDRDARTLARYLRANSIRQFGARNLRRTIGGELRDTTRMNAACAVLTEAVLLRDVSSRAGPTKGQPRKEFEVHPIVWASGA